MTRALSISKPSSIANCIKNSSRLTTSGICLNVKGTPIPKQYMPCLPWKFTEYALFSRMYCEQFLADQFVFAQQKPALFSNPALWETAGIFEQNLQVMCAANDQVDVVDTGNTLAEDNKVVNYTMTQSYMVASLILFWT